MAISILLFIILLILPAKGYTQEYGINEGDIIDFEYELHVDGDLVDSGVILDAKMEQGAFIEGFYQGILGM